MEEPPRSSNSRITLDILCFHGRGGGARGGGGGGGGEDILERKFQSGRVVLVIWPGFNLNCSVGRSSG